MSEKFIVEGGLSIPSGKFLELAGIDVSATATEINLLDGMTAISTDTDLGTSDTTLATQNAIKTYVDNQLGASVLTFTTDTDGNNNVDLDEDVLTFAGVSGIGVTHSDDTITIAMDDLNSFDTDSLTEGSSNLYYLDSRARAAVSVTDNGGDGSMSYDNSTGVISYTGPSASETRAHFSAVDNGGDGSFSYADGVYTYTGPSASETRAHFSVADSTSIDMSVSDGEFSATAKVDDSSIEIDATNGLQVKAEGVTNSMLEGSIANAKLANSSVSYGGVSLSLGGTDATPAFDLSDATAYPGDTSLVTTGALDSGSITSGFGAIDIGTSTLDCGNITSGTISSEAITSTGSSTMETLTVSTSAILADGSQLASDAAPVADTDIANKKYVDDQLGASALSAATDSGNMNPIDLDSEVLTLAGGEGMNVTHSDNTVTIAAELATETNAGVATFDGTDFTVTDGDVAVNAERVQDIIGEMIGESSASVQNGISVSYDDDNGELDFDVNDPTITISGDVSGSATMTNLGDVTITVAQQDNSVDLTTHTTGDYVATVTGGTGLTSTGATTGEGVAHSLSVDANQDGNITSANSLVTVGALASGSIASDFGAIDNGSSTLNTGAATVDSLDVSSGGITQAGSIAGATTIDGSGDLTMGSITMTGFSVTAAGLTTMLSGSQLSSDSADAVTAAADIANKAYVDSVVTAADLDFTSDGGETLSIDLDSETLTVAGGSNLTTSAADNTITVALDNDVTITGDMTSGTITNAEFTVDASGNTDIDGTLDVASTVNLAAAGVATTVRGTLAVVSNTDIDGTLDVASTVDLAASGVATTVRGTLAVTEAATFTAEAEFNGGINCDGDLNMETNAIIGTADNMLLFADDSSSTATEHSFANDDDGVLALQAADHVRSLNDIIPNSDSAVNLGSSSKHWSTVYGDNVRLDHAHVTSFNSGAISGDDATSILSWGHNSFKSAKISMNIKSGNDYTAREVIVVCDENGNNAKLVEYGTLSTGSELGTLSVAKNGAQIELRVASADGMDCTGVVSFTE